MGPKIFKVDWWRIEKRTVATEGVAVSTLQMASGEAERCCGELLEPHLAEARDQSGRMLFATVWICPKCSRISYRG